MLSSPLMLIAIQSNQSNSLLWGTNVVIFTEKEKLLLILP